MFRRILLCFDGSECARKAAEAALQLAASQNARMQVILVIPVPQHAAYAATLGKADADFERGRSYFMAAQQEVIQQAMGLRIQVDSRIVIGNVARTIVQCAEIGSADLIVLGHRGDSAPWGMTEYLVRRRAI